ncbi:MAG: uridine kinase, partial [Erysipelothrix sp.]|nr:uridine kinase [Erysipelothrix sp.]
MKPIVIGLAGGSASGKSSIAKKLKSHFETTQNVVIVRMDDYYKDQSNVSMELRLETNYDHPFAFDMDLLLSDIRELKDRKSISKPVYDFMNHTRSDYTEHIEACDVI